jgi:hypothetical protein
MVKPLAQPSRRRADAHSVAETLATAPEGAIARTFTMGTHAGAVYSCGCVAVDPAVSTAQLQLLECPTHAALQAKLRRRQSDRS